MSIHMRLLIVILAITIVYAAKQRRVSEKRRCIICITVILTCFSGLRSWQMGDNYHYCYAYLVCSNPSWSPDFSSRGDTIGIQLFFRLAYRLNLSFEVCVFIIAAFSAVVLGILVFKYSSSPYISYMIYICLGSYVSSFDILKQTIAMGFVAIALIQLFESKPFRFLIWMGVAASFHIPALIFLAAYPFARKRIDKAYWAMLCALIIFVLMFRNQIVEFATMLYYSESMFEPEEQVGGKALLLLLILVAAAYVRPIKNYDRQYRYLFNIIVLGTIIQSFSVFDNVFSRLADYYLQFLALFVPMLFETGWQQAKVYPEQKDNIRYWPNGLYVAGLIAVSGFSLIFYMRMIGQPSDFLSQFHFLWEGDTPYSLDLVRSMYFW